MHTEKECLQLIEAVRDIASDPESAYLLRTRVKRSLLSIIRLAANDAGMETPRLPRAISLPDQAPPRSRDLIASCNCLLASTRKLCQPSESLDTRWNDGWATVLEELTHIEKQLRDYPEAL